MNDETIQLARAELNKLRKITYRGPHPQRHLFEYFDWMEKKIADDAAMDMTAAKKVDELRECNDMNLKIYASVLLGHTSCIGDLGKRLAALEERLDAQDQYLQEQNER